MKSKRLLSIIIMCSMIITLATPVASFGAAFSDIKGHWAENWINQAVTYGFVDGYPDGTFRPDRSVSRAEFTTMVNKALGNSATSSITFTDVPHNEWFYQEVSKAFAATYVGGYEDNTFKPNSPITRQEAAVMISRIIPTRGSSGNLSAFPDRNAIADWAHTAFLKVNGKGYIGAYNDGNLHPLDNLTRAQTAKIICDILENETVVKSDPVVRSSGTTLSNTIYSNGVTISRDLNDGNATIENCVILGNLSVQGGGSNTVTVSNSRVAHTTVEKSSSSVRVRVTGETVISTLTAARQAIIETSNLTGGLYGSGINNLNTLSSSDITLRGTFPLVSVNGADAKFELASGTITKLIITNNARRSNITVASGATVTTTDVNAESHFWGNGTIGTMNVNANGVTYEKKPNNVNVGSSYKGPEEATPEGDITFKPANGTTKVALDTTITITFSEEMTLYNGNAITNSNISDFVRLREGSASGSNVDYTARINNSKTIITITPENPLKDNTRYYITMARNTVADSDGNGNEAQSVWFSTGTDSDYVTFDPKHNATGVALDKLPTITFSEAVLTNSGNSLSNSYFDDSVIIFREGSSSGTRVRFTTTYNSSSRLITITPVNTSGTRIDLKENQTYYLGIANNKIKTSKDGVVISEHVTWATRAPASVVSDFSLSMITAPSAGAAPYKTNIDKTQYTGTITWSGGNPATFAPSTVYTATVVLTAKSGYTFTGVAANKFTCPGATTITNPANGASSGTTMTVTIAFPTTGTANKPGEPQNLTLTPGETNISVSWTAPSSTGGSAITGYKIQLDSATVITKGASELTHNFTGLTGNTAYTVKVWAVNALGDSAPAERVATTTAPELPVFVPVNTITGISGTLASGSHTLNGTVSPSNATSQTIVWSMVDAGGTGSTVSGNTLNAAAAGDIIIRATIANGLLSGSYTQDFPITITVE